MFNPVAIMNDKPLAVPPATSLFLDTYPGAEAAVSLRKLSSTYTGDCIRVRESDGDTEADIGFDESGVLDTAALASHCGVDSGYVTKFYDQSGNGYDWVMTNSLNQFRIYDGSSVDTLNGKPALNGVFGVSSYSNAKYLINNSYSNTGNQVFGMTVSATGTTALNDGAFKYGRIVSLKVSAGALDYNTSTQYISLYFQVTSNPHEIGAGQNNVFAIPANNIITTEQYIHTFNKNGTANFVTIQDPDVVGNTASNTISAGNLAVTTAWIGRDRTNGEDSAFKGYIQEIILYNTEQSTNRTAMISEVNSFYGAF